MVKFPKDQVTRKRNIGHFIYDIKQSSVTSIKSFQVNLTL